MNSQNNFKQIEHENSQAVISFDNGTTFKIEKLMDKINMFFRDKFLLNLSSLLQQDGIGMPLNNGRSWDSSVGVEMLEPKSGKWQKGKMRMRVVLEFCPDEPEEIVNDEVHQDNNSLDDIRQTIH